MGLGFGWLRDLFSHEIIGVLPRFVGSEVKLKLKRGGETWWSAKTETKHNCAAPVP